MTHMISFLALACAALAACTGSPPAAAQKDSGAAMRITTATTVRVRAEPNPSAAVVAELGIGRILREVDRTPSPETIGQRTDTWRRVVLDDVGNDGWVFGAFLAPFDASARGRIYREIAEERLRNENLTFGDWADLADFLDRAVREVTDGEALAPLELARLRALGKAGMNVPYDRAETPTIKGWLDRHAADLVYDEIGGAWYVKGEVFWGLHDRYKDSPLADEIAWAAAQNPIPGECEGYLPCEFDASAMTDGKYLGLHPRGSHAKEAVEAVATWLSDTLDGEYPRDPKDVSPEDKPDLMNRIAELRAAVARTSTPKTKAALDLLDRTAGKYR